MCTSPNLLFSHLWFNIWALSLFLQPSFLPPRFPVVMLSNCDAQRLWTTGTECQLNPSFYRLFWLWCFITIDECISFKPPEHPYILFWFFQNAGKSGKKIPTDSVITDVEHSFESVLTCSESFLHIQTTVLVLESAGWKGNMYTLLSKGILHQPHQLRSL